jgi:hypothetical protein
MHFWPSSMYFFTDLLIFGTDICMMLLISCEFRENRCRESHTFLTSVNEILLIFYALFFCPICIKFGTGDLQRNLRSNCKFSENWRTSHTYEYCLIWMQFGIRDLALMLFSICEFRENWFREGHNLVMSINEITFTCVLWNRMTRGK